MCLNKVKLNVDFSSLDKLLVINLIILNTKYTTKQY